MPFPASSEHTTSCLPLIYVKLYQFMAILEEIFLICKLPCTLFPSQA